METKIDENAEVLEALNILNQINKTLDPVTQSTLGRGIFIDVTRSF